MELPREPTLLPQARRYQRKFEAPRGQTFREEETMIINIPPIDKTYLTKNSKFHFDFSLTYYESTSSNWQNLCADMIYNTTITPGTDNFVAMVPAVQAEKAASVVNGFFRPGTTLINAYAKPMPTLDINGPYGLINRIRVYDFLGTTLLEDVQEHDVLTAMLTDFDMKDENFQLNRPQIMDGWNSDSKTQLRKPPCSAITFADDARKSTQISINNYRLNYDVDLNITGVSLVAEPITINTHMVMDLYSFLGKLSEKFVPLHNGFRVEFTINKSTIPISFATANGDLKVHYKTYLNTNKSWTLAPYIQDMTITNAYLKCDLLELSPEMDSKTDKVVHYQGFKYQKDFFPYSDLTQFAVSDENRPDLTKRVIPSLRSLNKVFIGQRPVPTSVSNQKLGFRIKNYLSRGELLYNKAVIQSLDSATESAQCMVDALGCHMDEYLTMRDFSLEEPSASGTNGNQYCFLNQDARQEVQDFINNNPITTQWWNSFNDEKTVTVSNTAGNATFSTTNGYGHGLSVNDPIYVLSGAPTDITNGETYYVKTASYTTFTISSDIGGTAITPTGGSTDMTIRATNSSITTIPSNMDQGKFMLVFDTRIPGTTSDTVGGIDTSKQMLEYKIVADSDVCWKCYIDVLCQHDAFIKIDPGKTTLVSF